MKLAVFALALVAALIAAGALLLPLIVAHFPGLLGALGVVLLIAALFIRKKPTCSGLHCAGCSNHH